MVPCGLISCTRSPTFTSSTSARSVPIRMPGTSSGPRASASAEPLRIADCSCVTVISRTGSMPLTSMNPRLFSLVIIALPTSAGAAPCTRGSCRIFSISASTSSIPPALKT